MNNSTNTAFVHHENNLPIPSALKAAFYMVISVAGFLSVIGNSLEIIAFLKTQSLRTSSNYYITSMAVSDLLYVISSWILYSTSRRSVFEDTLIPFVCKLGSFLAPVSYSVSITSLVLVSVDRFVAIVFPMKVSIITARIRVILILLTYVVPIGFYFPNLYFGRLAREAERPRLCSTSEINSGVLHTAHHMTGFVILYLVPLFTIAILSSWIIKSLRKTNPVIRGNSQGNMVRHKRNQRTMKMLILIVVFFFLCWTPQHVSVFLNNFKMYVLEILHIVCVFILPFFSTLVNPVIIFTFSTNYRHALKNCASVVFVKCNPRVRTEQVVREENIELPELNAQ